jgi:hypothetical protein
MMASTTHPSLHLVSQAAAARRARFWMRFLTALLRALSVGTA